MDISYDATTKDFPVTPDKNNSTSLLCNNIFIIILAKYNDGVIQNKSSIKNSAYQQDLTIKLNKT